METRRVIIRDENTHARAKQMVANASVGYQVTLAPFKAKRTLEQNAHFHALCEDFARSGFPWMGKPRSKLQWKVLLISGHTTATTPEETEVIPGLEGEYVNVRESSSAMGIKRSSSLIDYTLAFAASNGIPVRAKEYE